MLLALGALLLFSCGGEARRPLVVFAASSLRDAFETIERDYERAHPDVDVQFSFAGSQVLRLQILQGAPADVFASANEAHIAAIEARRGVRSRTFATNELALLVPESSAITRFADLDQAERVVLGDPSVPVGAYTETLFENVSHTLGQAFVREVRRRVVSEEPSARLARARVVLGAADAAIVYRSDDAPGARVIPVPDELSVRANYRIASLAREGEPFVDHVLSPAGQRALLREGFDGAEAP